LFFGVFPLPTAPLFIAADGGKPAPRRETAVGKEAVGKIGGKTSGGKFLAGESSAKVVGSLARGPRPSDWRCREVPALPIRSCRTGAGMGAPAHLLGSLTRRLDFEGTGAGRFWSRDQFPCRPRFEKRFRVAGEMLLLLRNR
jgi:hypothetical protein